MQFASWLGLTSKAIAKHYPESEETMNGHGRKGRSGLCSTKPTEPPPESQPDNNEAQHAPIPKEYDIFIKVIAIEEEGNATMFLDQTGCFPKKSSRGNQYIMVLAHPDSNGILQEPMKNCTSGEMIRAYQKLIDRLKSAGITPKTPHPQQRVLHGFQADNLRQQHYVPTRSTPRSPSQYG